MRCLSWMSGNLLVRFLWGGGNIVLLPDHRDPRAKQDRKEKSDS